MKNVLSATASDMTASDTGSSWTLRHLVAGVVASLRKSAADRSLRRQLAGLDDAILRDIGIGEDEICRVRSGHSFTPRAWL